MPKSTATEAEKLKEKPTAPQSPSNKKAKRRKRTIRRTVFAVSFIAVALFGGFYFVQYNNLNDKYQEVTMSTEERDARTVEEVAKVIDLPKDQKPTYVRKVADKEKLKETRSAQSFFEKAENDDIVLAYDKADLAVIYRPSEKRVIKSDTYQNFLAATTVISVAVIAPSDKQDSVAAQLESKFGNVKIVSKAVPKTSNAANLVIDLSGANADTAKKLADQIGMTVGQLPSGETKPEGAVFAVVIPAT